MSYSRLQVGYLMGILAFAFWWAYRAYQQGPESAGLMANTTGVFSNIIFAGILVMGTMLFLFKRGRRIIT